MRWTCSTHEVRNVHKILVSKLEGKRQLRRPRRTGDDNIRMDFKETGWEGVDWIHMTQDRDQWQVLRNTIMNLRIP
jgi:hypothetical protein